MTLRCEALLAAPRVVFDGGVVFDHAADDLEEADAAGEGSDMVLKTIRANGSLSAILRVGALASASFRWRGADGHGRALDRRGRVGLMKSSR